MKQHTMEVHHEVYDEDPDWRELMVDDEKNKYFHAQQVSFFLTNSDDKSKFSNKDFWLKKWQKWEK